MWRFRALSSNEISVCWFYWCLQEGCIIFTAILSSGFTLQVPVSWCIPCIVHCIVCYICGVSCRTNVGCLPCDSQPHFFFLERQGFTLLSVETYTCRLQEISNCQSFILFDMFKYTYSLWSHFICLRISVKRWNIKRKYCCGSSFMCELHRGIWFIVVLRADVSSCKLAALLMISIALREDGECNLQ